MAIANKEYIKAKKETEDKNYFDGMSSCFWRSEDLIYSVYNENEVFLVDVSLENLSTDKSTEEMIDIVNENYNTPNYFEIKSELGKRNYNETAKECFYSICVVEPSDEIDPRYSSVKPMKYVAYTLPGNDDTVYVSFTTKSGDGGSTSVLGRSFSIERATELSTGSGDHYSNEKAKTMVDFLLAYVAK